MIKRIRKFCLRKPVNLCFKKFVIPVCGAFIFEGSLPPYYCCSKRFKFDD